MRLALISDIHANLEALQATVSDIVPRDVDRIVCLGDIVGYNAKPAECIALLRRIDALCVAGNHDLAVCGRMTTKNFSKTAAHTVAWTRRQLGRDELNFLAGLPLKASVGGELIAVHGALYPASDYATARLDSDERRVQSFRALIADPSGAHLCAFGHTHRAATYEFQNGQAVSRPGDNLQLRAEGYYLLNPGTVGQPRAGDRRASYMIVDLARHTVSRHYVGYDVAAALAATRQAGLAPAWAFVPAPVRDALASGLRAVRLERPVRRFAAYIGL